MSSTLTRFWFATAALSSLLMVGVSAAAGEDPRTIVDRAEPGQAVEILVAQTPFYGESGGQVGDSGVLRGTGEGAFVMDVKDTRKPASAQMTSVRSSGKPNVV